MNKPKKILKLNSLPKLSSETNKPINGIYEKCFKFCTNNFNSKCKEYYKNVKLKKGYYICPYGFSSLNTEINGKQIIYTSFELKGKRNRSLAKKYKSKQDNKRVFSIEELEEIIKTEENSNSIFTAKNNILRDYDKNTSIVEHKKEILDDTLHELRKLNNMLKKQAFTLKTEVGKEKSSFEIIKQLTKNIYATTQAVSIRLNAYDFTLNPDIIEANPKKNIGIYRKFEKARHNIKVITKEDDISIDFIGNSRTFNECYDIIEILPYILFDNAIKYNHDKNNISCEFIEKNGLLEKVIVSNKAILPSKSEIKELTEKHFRSSISKSTTGSGKGLYIASLICEYHDYELIIETEEEKEEKEENNKIIGMFNVIIKIQ